jgi:hypothetical protein
MTNLTKFKEEGDREFDEKIEELSQLGEPKTAEDAVRYYKEVKNHIHQREDKAYQLGQQDMLERVREEINMNQIGSFTDDAGNDCWYIDDLLKALDNLITK